MQKKKQSLYMQDRPGNSQSPKKSHRKKSPWQKLIFKILFKGIEAIWMVVQIIQYLSEIFKM